MSGKKLIRFNDPVRQFNSMRSELEKAALDAMSSGWWLSGSRTEAFSADFSGYLNVKHVLPVANGTDALELCLRAIGAGEDTEVITVANAGGYASTACRSIGATPVYVDINDTDLLMSVDEVSNMLSDRTVAVVATHLYGNVVDIPALRRTLDKSGRRDVRIIEDCAQAHGARIGGKCAGSIGDIAAFSFYPTKNLGALGDAGAVATSSDEFAEKVKRLRQYGWGNRYDVLDPYGRNSRMDEIQAAVLATKLKYLDQWNERRRAILDKYSSALSSIKDNRLIWNSDKSCVGHLAVILCHNRQEAADSLNSAGVETSVHYPTLDPDQPGWRDLPSRSSSLTNSRYAVSRVLSIPCYPELEEREVKHICSALSELHFKETGGH